MLGGLVGVALGLMLALQPAEGEASQEENA
jgi:hypothetical protein